jgi:hypothetical protein
VPQPVLGCQFGCLQTRSSSNGRREAARSARSVVDVRPLGRPTAEAELCAAQPALNAPEPELRDCDRQFACNHIVVALVGELVLDFVDVLGI